MPLIEIIHTPIENKACGLCDADIFEERTKKFLGIFGLKLFLYADEKIVKCLSCDKRLFSNIIKTRAKNHSKKVFEVERENEYSKRIIIEEGPTKKYTRTITNYSEGLPNVENTLLLSETMVGIVTLMSKLDYRIPLFNNDAFDDLVSIYSEHSAPLLKFRDRILDQDDQENLKLVKEKFTNCKDEFTFTALEFILKRTLSFTKGQLLLTVEIEDLFKDLLIIADYGEIGLDVKIAQLRN